MKKLKETKSCEICSEEIIDIEIRTKESDWFYPDEDVKFCPYCGKQLT